MASQAQAGDPARNADQASRERLRAVATELFFANGYAATTTRQISEHAGIQKATLYHYISTKEDLLFDICAESLQQMEAALTTALYSAPRGSELECAIRAHLDQALNNVAAHCIMLIEMPRLSDRRRADLIERRTSYERRIQNLIVHDQVAGLLRKDISERRLTLALMDLINWPIVWYRPGGAMNPSEVADFLIEIYLRGAQVQPGS